MSKIEGFLVAPVLLLFFPGVASAHSPAGFMKASLVAVIIAAVLAPFAKRLIATALFKVEKGPGVGAYIGIGVLEVILMFPSFTVAAEVSSSTDTGSFVLTAFLIFLLPATLLNFLLVRTANTRIVKAVLFSVVFPVLLIASATLLFLPLYTMFGG